MKRARLAAAIAMLAGFTGIARADCNAPFGWWESPGLMPLFTSAQGPSPTTDCDFHVWSWTAFVHWMQTDPATKQPLFLALPTFDDLKSGNAARAKVGPRKLALAPRVQKPKEMSSIEQAGPGGIIVDRNGRVLYYSTHMDPVYFQFTQQYFGPDNYKKAADTTPYPIAATVFKASWRIVPAGQSVTDAFTTTADIALLESDGKGGLRTTSKTQSVTVALVGIHVVGVIKDHPEFAWGTFEHVGNAPDLPAGMSPSSPNPVDPHDFTFYKGGTPANQSNVLVRNFKIDPATQVVSPIVNVFRQFAYGGAQPPNRVADIQSANQNFQGRLKQGTQKTIAPVFGNYRLIGTVWIEANTLRPGDGNLDTEAIGSVSLANATLETFVQGATTNCFSCHNTSGGKTYPGKDINISHIILGGLPKKAPTLQLNP